MQYIPEDSQSVRNSVSQDNVALAPADSGTGIHKVKDREIDRDAIFNAVFIFNLVESE